MGIDGINLKQLYRGYVLSFHSLGVQIYENERNRPLFTHQVISYWARVALSLGYYPWAGEGKRDLAWYEKTGKGHQNILHIESENSLQRREHTLEKLKKSSEEYRIGIIFVGAKAQLDEETLKEQLEQDFKEHKTLIITTWWNRKIEKSDIEGTYTVTGHYIESGTVTSFEESHLIWREHGFLEIIFPNEASWNSESPPVF